MKVVFFSTATSYSGGAIITLLDVVKRIKDKGIEPYFILKGHGPLEQMLKELNFPYSVIKSYDWCVPESKTRGIKNKVVWKVKKIINFIAEIETLILLKKIHADIYHLNCIYNGTGVKAAHFLKIPVVWHLREFVDLPNETTMFMNSSKAWRIINNADKIICVSDYLKEYYISNIKDKTKIYTIYDGIDMSRFNSEKKNYTANKQIVIGLAGTATVKNHEDAIYALGLLKEEGMNNIVLKIAGRWALDDYNQRYKEKIIEIIRRNNLKEEIEFVGMKSNMNQFWRESDISLICSKRESFGLSAVEAMACGVPLICSNTSVSGELTNDGKYVLTYRTGDYKQLANQIKLCICQLGWDILKQRTEHAESFVRRKFSIEKSAEGLCKIYQEVFNGDFKDIS